MPALASSSSSSARKRRGAGADAGATSADSSASLLEAAAAPAGVPSAAARGRGGVDARGSAPAALPRAEDRGRCVDARRIAASTATRSAASTSSATRLLTSGVAPTRDAARASSWTSRSLMRPPLPSPRVEGAASLTPARVARGVAERAATMFRSNESASGADEVARERQYASSSSRCRACSRRRWTASAASRVSHSSSVSPSRGCHGARAMRPALFQTTSASPRRCLQKFGEHSGSPPCI